jgi:hypothetical protein
MSRLHFFRVFGLSLIANLAWAQSPVFNDAAPYRKGDLAQVPMVVRYKISAAVGEDDSRYRVTATGYRFNAENSSQGFSAIFRKTGLSVRAGSLRWNLAVRGYGYGSRLRKAGEAVPASRDNRVEYRRGILTEWYVNGPLGLEQGFTFDQRPGEARGKSLTVAMALSGDLKASLDPGASGITLIASDGRKVLRYAGLTAFDSNGRRLDAWLELGGEQNLLLHVADGGAHYPLVIDPFVQVAKLVASDGAIAEDFGDSVSISSDGNTIAIGAQAGLVGSPNGEGEAYVFIKPAGGWTSMTEVARLTPSDANGSGSSFGFAVAISGDGDTVAVGAPQAVASLNPFKEGASYVFVKPLGGWTGNLNETAKLTASDAGASDKFGSSIGIGGDGSTIVVGSPQASPGAAYIFVRPSSGWVTTTESAKLTASSGDGIGGTLAFTSSGHGVAISSDNTIVVAGAPLASAGEAFVFVEPSGGWSGHLNETAELTASDGVAGGFLGDSVAVTSDGSLVVAGAESVSPAAAPGAAYVFVKPAAGWATTSTFDAKLTASDGINFDQLGHSVAITGDGQTIVAGAANNPYNAGNAAVPEGPGAVYQFAKPAGGWSGNLNETAKLTASDGQISDHFGGSVAISDDGCLVVVGALKNPYDAVNQIGGPGASYVFHCLISTTSALLSSANPSVFGQTVGFTATVTPASGSANPGGNILFSDGSTTLGSIPLVGGQATFTTSSLAVGSHSIAAVYAGDGTNFQGSTSPTISQIVNMASTTTTVSSSANPATLNQTITLTATVSVSAPGSGTPTGTVTFQDGSSVLASGVSLSTSGTAAFSTSSLAIGSHSITAAYSGDGNFNGSTGSLTQQVAYTICVLYDQTKSVHSGAVFPIKLELCDASGNDVSSPAIVLHATAVTMVSGFVGVPESPGNANPDNDFRFDGSQGSTGGYIFNLKTTGLAGGTYLLQFTAGADPVPHAVNFGVK